MTLANHTGMMLEHLFRHQSSRILAHLTRLLGPAHLELAEEAVQEAMLRAWQTWPHQGMPENAPAWLFRVAHNAAIDAVRRNRIGGQKSATVLAALSVPPEDIPDFEGQLRDDELRLVFMCCHPGIPREARVVLSLKIAGGFSVREIARALLADDAAIAQRLVRAKRTIRDQHLTLDMQQGAELKQRLDSVIEVIYLMFNEGYTAHEGEDLIRTDLCFEALRLGQLIASSSIAEPRVHALMALMAMQAARLPARTDEAGDLILLEDQDRTRWDRNLIAIGFHHFDRAIEGDEASEYHLQAAIAAIHARAEDRDSVDWSSVLDLYDRLYAMNPSPVVALNRAVAISRVRGPADALLSIETLKLDGYYLFHTVRGHLLLELSRHAEAADCFREALKCRCSEPERRFIRRKMESYLPGALSGSVKR
jgi:RNA polymerase sigma-70 factor, ECF subfamily